MENLKTKVSELIAQEPKLLPVDMAERLAVSEFEVVAALPSDMVAVAVGEHAQAILETLPEFGQLTTIMHAGGSIFEVKAVFPRGSMARGYYNLFGQTGELHGHLKLDNIAHVALVSKPFMGKESHYFGFFSQQGENIFKVYLGRDDKRQLLPDQVHRFKQMQAKLKQPRIK
ncbi:heme utilization protein HuvX [Vibrio xiamenensis]|uniref:Heme utilization protein HuvX n=1 Tax=Vibrio xiamenensis TaxID=861298 RepID=A0A1G8ANU5_9VIBR|nr:heme utilization cystosolic carrier protein HutX [Vibrio xiamenensis]SDH22732.1 heme utilization protein HuvX [Vibrio xiamenensis]